MATTLAEASAPPDLEDRLALRDVTVTCVRLESSGVVSITVEPVGDARLPAWDPGSHVDVVLPSGTVRQYSLCGVPDDGRSYRIAVLREPDGRGGSAEIHDSGLVGRVVQMRGPRNHFSLAAAPSYLFVAGGIGITPILSMVRSLDPSSDFRVLYGGRTRASMAFLDELRELCGDRLTVVPQDEAGLMDLDGALQAAPAGASVYCCGPAPLLDAMTEAVGRADHVDDLHVERFTAGTPVPDTAGGPTDDDDSPAARGFEVELRQSGYLLTVGPEDLLIDVVREKCPDVMSSCEEGFCGTCETRVLEGEPEHHDTILSEREREEGKTMMICVGRSKSPKLVLDL